MITMGYVNLGAGKSVAAAAGAVGRRIQVKQEYGSRMTMMGPGLGGSLSSGAITALLVGAVILGGIGYLSKKQRETRFRSKLGLRGRR